MFYSDTYLSPIGGITLAGDGQSLVGLWFDGQKYFLRSLPEPPVYIGARMEPPADGRLPSELRTDNRLPTEPLADVRRLTGQAENAASVLAAAKRWLDRYFAGEEPLPAELPLAPVGSPFRQAVWKLLCGIPYGETTTYGAIAKKLAPMLGRETMSAQAVGGAVAHNPISVIIPCHRVLGSDGSLTGYAGGIDKKIWLLKKEGAWKG